MANMTAREQLMLELINRARMDPRGEAERLDVTLSAGQGKPVPVLAGNDALRASAFNHSGWMLLNDRLTITETKGSDSFIAATPIERMRAYGYSLSGAYSYGENVSWAGEPDVPDFTASILAQHESLFASAGNRARMLDANFQEAGIGQQAGAFVHGGTTYIASMVTQDFIRSGARVFITGVIYDDTGLANHSYDLGEGTASRRVSSRGVKADMSGAGGGYELQFGSSGIKTVTFRQPGDDLKLDVLLGTANVKVDAVDGSEIWTNGSVQSQSVAITELHALGVSQLVLIGSAAAETIVGNRAVNQLLGLGGGDTISGRGGADTIAGGAGGDVLAGGGGADVFAYTAIKESRAQAPDTIADFGVGADRIELSALFAGTLTYRGEAPINGAHQVSVSADGGDVVVHINLHGTLADDMRIVLQATSLGAMTAGDFVL